RDSIFAPLKVYDVARPKFSQPQKSRPVDRVRFRRAGHERANWQPREIVAGNKTFIGQISVSIEICFGPMGPVQQQLDFPHRLPLLPLAAFLRPSISQSGVINNPPGRIALCAGSAIEVAPAIECAVERLWGTARDPLDPCLRIPCCALNLRL